MRALPRFTDDTLYYNVSSATTECEAGRCRRGTLTSADGAQPAPTRPDFYIGIPNRRCHTCLSSLEQPMIHCSTMYQAPPAAVHTSVAFRSPPLCDLCVVACPDLLATRPDLLAARSRVVYGVSYRSSYIGVTYRSCGRFFAKSAKRTQPFAAKGCGSVLRLPSSPL
jgi:hypothetical protein